MFADFSNAEVPFAIPHKRKLKERFNSKDGGWTGVRAARGEVRLGSDGIRNCVREKSAGTTPVSPGVPSQLYKSEGYICE